MKSVLVLGCTGSIGKSVLSLMRSEPGFRVCGLTAHRNSAELSSLAKEFGCPSLLTGGIPRERAEEEFSRLVEQTRPDVAVNGIAGSAGLPASVAVLGSGVDLALANKESVVMAHPLISAVAARTGAKILPVDSEHSAVFTLLGQCGRENAERIVLTASGGPFRTWDSERIRGATLSDALRHPTWSMGVKITVDSATMANKGLEVIEACRLFGFAADDVQVVVHPESVVHSLVRLKDGAVYAQLSEPDMRHPILSALTWPDVRANSMRPFDLTDTADGRRTLTFERPRLGDFPLLPLAYRAARGGGSETIAYNAANEVAAAAFIDGRIPFARIAETVAAAMDRPLWSNPPRDLADVFEADAAARREAGSALSGAGL